MIGNLTNETAAVVARFASPAPPATSTTAPPASDADPVPIWPKWVAAEPYRRVLPQTERQRDHVYGPAREAFAKAAKTGRGWPLYFHGLQGRGKTTASLWFLDNVLRPFYCTGRELVDFEFCTVWSRKEEFREQWKAASLCVVDQFGMSGKQGPGQTQAQIDLIDKRCGRPLILVSNLAPAELDDVFDAQVRSRIEQGTKVEFKGLPDYRVIAGKARQ